MKPPALRALIAATEIFPLAKTGGMADATASLGAALAELGVDVHFIMPAYTEALEQVQSLSDTFALPPVNGLAGGLLLSGRLPDSGLPISLVDFPSLYRDGGGLYVDENGHERRDNPQRFAALSHAVSLLALGHGNQARFDIVHCNDWQTGLIPLMLFLQAGTETPASVFTIHNMAFQGVCSSQQWSQLGVRVRPELWPKIEYYGQASFLKVGLEFADELTTVSPRYAEEIQTAEFGFGLQGVVQARKHRLTGILNGIDVSIWSPERSPWLRSHYGVGNMAGKIDCKEQVQLELELQPAPSAPLMVFIGRLTWQKMADVLLEAVPEYLAREPDRQFVLLGNGDRHLEAAYLELAERYPGRVAVQIEYTERMAHRLHAGADILIHGSRFEPCGLTQLYAMRFGTIPVVRPVGGLADTVVDATAENLAAGLATGFYFDQADTAGMLEGIDRAVALFRQPQDWEQLQQTAMQQDFSWEASARAYLDVYRRARGH